MSDHQENGGAVDQEMQDVIAGADVEVESVDEFVEPQRIRVVSFHHQNRLAGDVGKEFEEKSKLMLFQHSCLDQQIRLLRSSSPRKTTRSEMRYGILS